MSNYRTGDYFVLRLDKDSNALKALLAYAVSVIEVNPLLAFDLFKKVQSYMNGLPDHELTLMHNASLEKQLNHLQKTVINQQFKKQE